MLVTYSSTTMKDSHPPRWSWDALLQHSKKKRKHCKREQEIMIIGCCRLLQRVLGIWKKTFEVYGWEKAKTTWLFWTRKHCDCLHTLNSLNRKSFLITIFAGQPAFVVLPSVCLLFTTAWSCFWSFYKFTIFISINR